MNNMINLIPYLPQQVTAERSERRSKRRECLWMLLDSVLTLCIGAGFFLMLFAFLATM